MPGAQPAMRSIEVSFRSQFTVARLHTLGLSARMAPRLRGAMRLNRLLGVACSAAFPASVRLQVNPYCSPHRWGAGCEDAEVSLASGKRQAGTIVRMNFVVSIGLRIVVHVLVCHDAAPFHANKNPQIRLGSML